MLSGQRMTTDLEKGLAKQEHSALILLWYLLILSLKLRGKKENVIVCKTWMASSKHFFILVIKLPSRNGSKDSAQQDGNKT